MLQKNKCTYEKTKTILPEIHIKKLDEVVKPVISCMGIVVCIKNSDIYVALLRDVNNCWVIPKGHLEKNETFIETIIREIKEETNIDINICDFVGKVGEYEYYSDIEKTMKLIKIYLFRIDEFQPIASLAEENFVDGKWLLLGDAIEKVTYQEQKAALEKIKLML